MFKALLELIVLNMSLNQQVSSLTMERDSYLSQLNTLQNEVNRLQAGLYDDVGQNEMDIVTEFADELPLEVRRILEDNDIDLARYARELWEDYVEED